MHKKMRFAKLKHEVEADYQGKREPKFKNNSHKIMTTAKLVGEGGFLALFSCDMKPPEKKSSVQEMISTKLERDIAKTVRSITSAVKAKNKDFKERERQY